MQTGMRESGQSWKELLVDLKVRGLSIAPDIAVGDGALGFWKALDEAFPLTRHQRCWQHKTLNVLDKLPKSVQPNAHRDLREIWLSENRAVADAAMTTFAEKYAPKYDKAVDCLLRDRDALLAFFDFPAEHWTHLRTSNPIESAFATVRSVKIDHPDPAFGLIAMLKAVGSTDRYFLEGLLQQLVSVGSPGSSPDEAGTNFALAIVKGIEPRDQIEAMLASQMGAVHNATMTFARRLAHVETIQQQDSAQTALNKLARTFAAQVEALKRYRSSGEQKMTVQHVHVAEGGQAIVGNVSTTAAGGGAIEKSEEQPHALGYAPGIEMPRQIEEERAPVPSASRPGDNVCRMHGGSGGAPRGNRNALKYGGFTADTLALKREIQALAQMARETMAAIE